MADRSDSPYRPPSRRRRKIIGIFYDDYESYDSDDSQHLAEWVDAPPEIPASFYECAPLPDFCKVIPKKESRKTESIPTNPTVDICENVSCSLNKATPCLIEKIETPTPKIDTPLETIPGSEPQIPIPENIEIPENKTPIQQNEKVENIENVDSDSESFEFVTKLLVEPETSQVDSNPEPTTNEKEKETNSAPNSIQEVRPRLSLASLEKLNQFTLKNSIQFSALEQKRAKISAISTFDVDSRSAATQNALKQWKAIHKN